VSVAAEDPEAVRASVILEVHHRVPGSIEESAYLPSVPVDGLTRDTLTRQKNQKDDQMQAWSEPERPAIICVMLMKSYEVTQE
jgi:hypothetical protein